MFLLFNLLHSLSLDHVRKTIEWLVGEEQLQYYLELFRDTMFPETYEEPPPPTFETVKSTREAALKALLEGIPDNVRTLVGAKNARLGAERVFKALQYSRMNQSLMYTLLEKFLEHFLQEEFGGRDLNQV